MLLCFNLPLHKSHGGLSTRHSPSYIFPAMTSHVVSSTTIPPTQLESPRHAKDLEDCRKICLNVVSCSRLLKSAVPYFTIAHSIPNVSSILIEQITPDCLITCSLQSITGSTGLAVATLTLMLYTISLHIAAAAGASRVKHFTLFLQCAMTNNSPAAARGGYICNFACHPSSRNFHRDISAVGARGEITDSGDFYHHIVFPSYHGDNFSIPRHNYP